MDTSIPQNLSQCAFDFDALSTQPIENLPSQVHQTSTPFQKRCTKCQEIKDFDQFHKGHNVCKVCRCASNRERYLRIKNAPVDESRLQDESKRCPGPCGRTLPATSEFFQRNKGQKSGWSSRCKDCKKIYTGSPEVKERHRQQEHMRYQRPEVKERARNYRQRPEVREHRRQYKRRPDVSAKARAYSQRSEVRKRKSVKSLAYYYRPGVHERMKERHRTYMRRPDVRMRENQQKRALYRNPEVRERMRAYRQARYQDPEKRARMLAQHREYTRRPEVHERLQVQNRLYYRREGVRERSNNQRRLAYQTNPEARSRRALDRMRRRVYKKAVPGVLTAAQIQYKLRKQRFRCYYCSAKFEKKNGNYLYHVDHTVPISRIEAKPRHDMSYTVLACASCNCKKGDKLPHEFPEGGRLF